MEFLGIGIWEMLLIATIALMVLGPKQMIRLSRQAGEQLRKVQKMWLETSAILQKEIETIDDGAVSELTEEIKTIGGEATKNMQSLQQQVTTSLSTPPDGAGQTPTAASFSPPTPNATTTAPAASADTPKLEGKADAAQPPAEPAKPANTYSAWIDKSQR